MTWKIYKITSPPGKAYIGLTKNSMKYRWGAHCRDAANGSDVVFHRAIRKHGAGNFKIEILTECVDAREAKACERALISAHATFYKSGLGYNLTNGGDGNWGWQPSEQTKARIGAKSKERHAADPSYLQRMIAGQKAGYKRPPRTPEWSAKIAATLKGRVFSPEWIEKIRQAGYKRKNSPETRAKISASNKGRVNSPEALARMAQTKRGKSLTAEHKAAISAGALKNPRIYTEKQKQERSARRLKWLENPENKARLMLNLKQYRAA